MADLRVKFIGDLGNLTQFFSSISGQASQTYTQLDALARKNIASRLNILPQATKIGDIGIGKLTLELDAYNNTLKAVGQTVLSTEGGLLPVGDIRVSIAELSQLTTAVKVYETELQRLRGLTETQRDSFKGFENAGIARTDYLKEPFTAEENRLKALRTKLSADLIDAKAETVRQQAILTANPGGVVNSQAQAAHNVALQEEVSIRGKISAINGQIGAQERAYQKSLETDNVLLDLATKKEAARAEATRLGALAQNAKNAQDAALNQAVAAGPPTSTGYRALPTNLRTQLEKQGLANTKEGLDRQNANFNDPRFDLTRQVARYSGQFDGIVNGTKVVKEFNAEVDSSGKVLTRFGGNLSGTSNLLKQIGRDFQKVIEFTIATTVVFGALRLAMEQITNLKALDAALQRFSITAQIAPNKLGESFEKLSTIAYNTATPILELISAADDIALATRKAGQSTEDWEKGIFSLTEAVGIFTNLTGTDTVKATDLLTATMKQLGLEANEVIGTLSKITAVAGGQSQAISDITQGLSVMAEAGKQAGLTVDQQIATIQVLSQVTSKSPAEVATSFKNLVGSLGSPGALKGLEKFNIAVRDQAGNLRNILDVYSEISQKIKSGIIPAADVQGLVRAISGGPRRAPDAAALLGAIDQIASVEKRSLAATNEAVIANAKVLDTTQAKLVKLQNSLNVAIFEKFGKTFKDFVGTLTTFLQSLLEGFAKIPTSIITGLLQIGAFFLLIRGGTKFLSVFTGLITEMVGGLLRLPAAFAAAAAGASAFNNSAGGGANPTHTPGGYFLGPQGRRGDSPVGGFLSRNKGNIGRLGVGAALGAGVTAASGGSGGQIAGGALTGIGLGLLAFPEPTLLTKIAGGIALIGGTILQFATAEKAVSESDADKAVKILDAYSHFSDATSTVLDLTTAQKQLSYSITELSGKANKNAEEFAQLSQNQKDYIDNIIATIAANREAAAAQKILLKELTPDQRQIFTAAKRGGASQAQLIEVIQSYQKTLLAQTNPEIRLPKDIRGTVPTVSNTGFAPLTGSTQAQYDIFNRGTQTKESKFFDLSKLEADASLVTRLFNVSGTAITSTFQVTGQNIALVQAAIAKLKETNAPLADEMLKSLNAFVALGDGITQAANNLAIYDAAIQAISIFDPTQAADLTKVLNIGADVISRAQSDTRQGPREEGGSRGLSPGEQATIDAQNIIGKAISTGKVDYADLTKLAQYYYSTLYEGSKNTITELEFVNEYLGQSGFNLQQLGINAGALGIITDTAHEAAAALEELAQGALTSAADKIAALQQQFLSGSISAKEFATGREDLLKYAEAAADINTVFSKGIETAGFEQAFSILNDSLTGIIGLEDAAGLSIDQFIPRILHLAETYGVSGKNLDTLHTQLINFYNLIERFKGVAIRIPISLQGIGIDAQIAALKKRLSQDDRNSQFYEDLLRELEGFRAAFGGAATDINKTLGTGTGGSTSKSGSSGGSGSKGSTSTLDLPDSIANSASRDALIQEAIKRARTLQGQIPGATKAASKDIVELLKGTQKILEVRGIKDDYLRKALEELAEVEKRRLEFDTKADTIRRIRVGAGDFSAIANVPLNSKTGVSVGGPGGPISVNLNINGQLLTPAQFDELANKIGAVIKAGLANG